MKVSQQPNVGGERPPREELCPIGGGPHPLALNSPGKSVEPPRSMTPWILRGIAQETSVVQSSPHEVVQSSLHLDTKGTMHHVLRNTTAARPQSVLSTGSECPLDGVRVSSRRGQTGRPGVRAPRCRQGAGV